MTCDIKKSNIDGDDDKDWGLKPKRKNMKLRRPKKEITAPRYSTDPKDLPEELKRKIETMEGIESFEKAKMIMVIEKNLNKTDLKDGANHLSMPLKQIKPKSFLDEDEIKFLADQREQPVSVISPRLEDEDLTFKQWNMHKSNGNVSSKYLFKTRWTQVYKKNQLQQGDVIQVWSFRDVGNNLHFALVLVEKAKKGGSGSDGDGDGGSVIDGDGDDDDGCSQGTQTKGKGMMGS